MKEVQNIIFEELEDLRKRIISNIDSTGRKASGRTSGSMHTDISENRGILFGRMAFGTLETGRKSGKVPAGFYQIIKQWVIDKGISFDSQSERNSFAYLVSRKIAREGTQLYRTGAEADVYTTEVPETIERIKDRVGFLMRLEFESIKLNK
ncbi:hypothetical protein H8S77_14340 [Parabacteroides sp. BX2]|jgi:hypothetical protein|uniref:Uncharacterized protein n=1 Tax=Parabacteroides segnis TaxID=2763058 RepID=A0ABR7E4L1_9BACT|nr:hypothetical protein [Parabacteroides sp. AF17-3]MBC5644059.1 hypothetical protein [Parabacteroides segnis]RKU71734.1 hypothetical protein DWW91_06905 [Parabacteroides sp. AF17-3]DAP74658.1 MAG TPA: hypothetical protein [Caudoviricetes sp.]